MDNKIISLNLDVETEHPKKKGDNQVLRYTSLGTQMLAYIALGVYGGLKLDEWLNTNPLFIILLSAVALFMSLLQLYRQLAGKA